MRFCSFARLLPAITACALLASCQNGGQKSSDPYVSNYGSDGGYNPYPGQPGTMQSGSGGGGYSPAPSAPATPTYSTPPAPTSEPSNPYAFSPGSSSSSSGSAAGGSSTPRKTPAKSTASTSSKSKPKAKAKSTAKKSSGSGSYKVVGGDTLYGIARKRGTTVAKIKAANKLSSDVIRPGQSLKIP